MGSNDHLRLWFQSVDVDNSGSINAAELRSLMKFYESKPACPELKSAAEFFRGSAHLAIAQSILPDSKPPTRALEAGNLYFPQSVISQMIKMYDKDLSGTMSFNEFVSLHKFLTLVQDTFSRNSRNRAVLPLNDVYIALQQAGYTLDRPSFYSVCQSFDKDRSGNFRLDDFMSICIFLQSAQNLFTAFDTAKTGHVTFDFNQFVYCSANLRI